VTARSKARKRALDVLFESDVRGDEPLDTLAAWVGRADPPVQDYARELVEGVAAHRARIDEVIASYARDWTIDRMPPVDRTTLRLATFELLWRDDVPDAVVIDEAVELAKSLSTDDSPGFVNGVLSQVLADKAALLLRPEARSPAGPQG
jgi:N utilization substance protein B